MLCCHDICCIEFVYVILFLYRHICNWIYCSDFSMTILLFQCGKIWSLSLGSKWIWVWLVCFGIYLFEIGYACLLALFTLLPQISLTFCVMCVIIILYILYGKECLQWYIYHSFTRVVLWNLRVKCIIFVKLASIWSTTTMSACR